MVPIEVEPFGSPNDALAIVDARIDTGRYHHVEQIILVGFGAAGLHKFAQPSEDGIDLNCGRFPRQSCGRRRRRCIAQSGWINHVNFLVESGFERRANGRGEVDTVSGSVGTPGRTSGRPKGAG
jgi:hypothetical protein